jgi:mannitol-1-/sugar-/sorbitol-6-phosphatase
VSLTLTCDAILFDLDGVLVDSHAVVERTWRRWGEKHGLDGAQLVRRAHGRRTIETVREVAPHLDLDEEVRWLAETELSDFEGIVALPGAAIVLRTLRDTEWAVVTSGGRELARRRLEYAALPVPEILIAAEDVQSGKPSPEGYLIAASRLGVDPSRCVVIEDTPPGIQAGRLAKAQTVALATTFPRADLTGADVVAESLAGVKIERSTDQLILHVAHDRR